MMYDISAAHRLPKSQLGSNLTPWKMVDVSQLDCSTFSQYREWAPVVALSFQTATCVFSFLQLPITLQLPSTPITFSPITIIITEKPIGVKFDPR